MKVCLAAMERAFLLLQSLYPSGVELSHLKENAECVSLQKLDQKGTRNPNPNSKAAQPHARYLIDAQLKEASLRDRLIDH